MDNENLLASIKAGLTQALPHEQKVSLCAEHITLGRFEHEHTCTNASIYKPMITFMINGHKQAWVGDKFLNYEPGDIFITGIEIPVQLMAKGASEQNPGLAVSVCIDPSILQEVMSQLPPLDQQELLQCEFSANSDLATTAELLTINRIVDLYTQGITYDFPYTLLVRELYFYVLTSQHGISLRKLFTNGAHDYKIAKVINYLRKHFRQDVAIDGLAQMVYMAVPTFYKHFKQVTSMSPCAIH